MKTLTRKQFEAILANYIAREKKFFDEHNEIREILRKVEGKPINGKTLNQKILGEKFKLKQEYGNWYIVGPVCSHLIGYIQSEHIVTIEPSENSRGFDYFDNCSGGAAKKRIEQIERMDKEKAFKLFSKVSKTFNELRLLFGDIETEKLDSFHFAAYYDVLHSIFSEDSKLRITDFYHIREYRK